VPASSEEILAAETRRRTLVGAAGIAAGVLTAAASLLRLAVVSDQPQVQLVGALHERLQTGRPVLKIQQALFFDDKGLQLIGVGVITALAAAATAFLLLELFKSVKARAPEFPRVAVVATVVGAVFMAVGSLAAYISIYVDAHSFAGDAHKTASAADDVVTAPIYVAGSLMAALGQALIGLAIILISLNAMRIGLLTRFLGVLGIIGGGLVIIPLLGGGLPLVEMFWLLAIGAMLLGLGPGRPPAWEAGTAVPWPSQQELREQRDAARAGRAPSAGQPSPAPSGAPADAPAGSDSGPHPAARKRKRKRRS
jgi:hypothetical protein